VLDSPLAASFTQYKVQKGEVQLLLSSTVGVHLLQGGDCSSWKLHVRTAVLEMNVCGYKLSLACFSLLGWMLYSFEVKSRLKIILT